MLRDWVVGAGLLCLVKELVRGRASGASPILLWFSGIPVLLWDGRDPEEWMVDNFWETTAASLLLLELNDRLGFRRGSVFCSIRMDMGLRTCAGGDD